MAPDWCAVRALEAEGAGHHKPRLPGAAVDELQAAARAPVVTSSLLQLPGLLAREPKVGVLTISAAALGTEHLLAAGVPAAPGRRGGSGRGARREFVTAILGNRDTPILKKPAAMWWPRRVSSASLLRSLVLECSICRLTGKPLKRYRPEDLGADG